MQRKTWLYYNLDSVWSNHLGKKQHTVAMEQMEIYDLGLKDAKGKILKKTTDDVNISKKCSQCEYASSVASNLRKHLKMHSGEKSNTCNECDFDKFSGHGYTSLPKPDESESGQMVLK